MKLTSAIAIGFALMQTIVIICETRSMEQAKTWPTSQGVIIRSEHGKPNRFSFSDYVIAYEYPVEGQSYSSSEFRMWGPTKADFDKYKAGMRVPVRYNPQSPSVAYVETEINRDVLPKMILTNIGAYILGIGLWFVKRRDVE